MYCKKCGKEINDNAKFCPGCGQVVQAGPDAGAPQAPAGDAAFGVPPAGAGPAHQAPPGQAPQYVPPKPPAHQYVPPKPPTQQYVPPQAPRPASQQAPPQAPPPGQAAPGPGPTAPLPGYGQAAPPPGHYGQAAQPPGSYGQAAPPPGRQPGSQPPPAYGQQPGQQAPPAYGQQPPPPGQFGQQPPPPGPYGQQPPPPGPYGRQPPPPGTYGRPPAYGQPAAAMAAPRRNNRLILIVVIAAVAAVIIGLLAYNLSGDKGKGGFDDDDEFISIDVGIDPPPAKDPPPFEPAASGFSTNDPNIKMIEVNQGLSYGFNTDTGEFYLMDNFVARKATAFFVTFEKPPSSTSEITLTVERDGEFVTALLPTEMIDDTTILFQPKDISDAGYWGQGAYTFTFTMDDSVAVRKTNLYESTKLKVLALPMKSNYSGKIRTCEGDWRAGGEMIKAVYPVAEDDVEYVIGPELDLSDDLYDLDTNDGRFNVWKALTRQQTQDNEYTLIVGFMPTPNSIGYLGYTYGMPGNIVCESEPDLLASVVHEIAHCYKIGDEYYDGSLNNVLNAPPYQMDGHDIITREYAIGEKPAIISGHDYGTMGSGSVIYPEQRAYYVEGRRLLGAVASYMSEGESEDSFYYWTTSDIWNHLFNVFTGIDNSYLDSLGNPEKNTGAYEDEVYATCPNCYADILAPPTFLLQCRSCQEFTQVVDDEFPCQACGDTIVLKEYYMDEAAVYCPDCKNIIWYNDLNKESGKSSAKTLNESDIDLIMVTDINGYIDPDGTFVADPWYSYPAPPGFCTASRKGEYSVSSYDKNGDRLALAYFDAYPTAQINTAEGQSFVEGDKIPVNVVIKTYDEAAKIVIKKGDKEIYTRVVSDNAPEVAFTGLTEGQELPDEVTVTWDASDADGDEIFFDLYYCANYSDYYLVASFTTERSIKLDMSSYPGSDAGYFYIYASDGVNTAETASPKFKVRYKEPVFITEQAETPKYKATEEVRYEVEIYDMQDKTMVVGAVWDEETGNWQSTSSVEWFLDGEPFFHSQTLVITPYELPPGVYTFTCVATNSGGLSASKDYSVEITDDESDLPDDWSRKYIKQALKDGFYLTLDRIDSPITRGQYARFMGYAFGHNSVLDSIYPDIRGEVADVYDGDDYNESLMVWLGVMETTNGSFESHKSLTEHEAALILYKVVLMATDPSLTLDDFDDEAIIKEYMEKGILNETGDGAYQPDEKLSKRLAMVRMSKLYDEIFGPDEEE